MGPYAGVDDNLTFCRLQHINHGQAYAKSDLYPMLVSTSSPSQGLWIWPQCDTNALHLLYCNQATIFTPTRCSIHVPVSLRVCISTCLNEDILVCRRVYIMNLFLYYQIYSSYPALLVTILAREIFSWQQKLKNCSVYLFQKAQTALYNACTSLYLFWYAWFTVWLYLFIY